jgi:hypothetical protein
MSDDAVRNAILARRARFLAAALVAAAPALGCKKSDAEIEPDRRGGAHSGDGDDHGGVAPQVCLKVAGGSGGTKGGSTKPDDSIVPMPCLEIAQPEDGGAPMVCLSVAAPPGDAGPRPTITKADVKVTGMPSAEAAVAKSKWRFRACYSKALAVDPTAGGTVVVAVTLASDGSVSSATASGGTPAMLGTCLGAAFRALTFPAPERAASRFEATIELAAK